MPALRAHPRGNVRTVEDPTSMVLFGESSPIGRKQGCGSVPDCGVRLMEKAYLRFENDLDQSDHIISSLRLVNGQLLWCILQV